MADVDSVRLAEGKARRTPDMRLSNAAARHKPFQEGFSVRRVSASSHAAFPRRNCRHSFDLQINKAAPPAGVCPVEQSTTSHSEDRALPRLSPVMDGSRRYNSRGGPWAQHRPVHPGWADYRWRVAGGGPAGRCGRPRGGGASVIGAWYPLRGAKTAMPRTRMALPVTAPRPSRHR